MSPPSSPSSVFPNLSRRRFIQVTTAATVMVHVSNAWWAPVVTAAPDEEKTKPDKDKDKDKPGKAPKTGDVVMADVRHAAVLGPPDGRGQGNVIVRSTRDKHAATTTWFAGGGRALSITTRTKVDKKGRTKPKPDVRYVDPTRTVVAGGAQLVPLSDLEQEIRTEFGDHEWASMLRRLD